MGQEEHESRVLAPLCAISREELVAITISDLQQLQEQANEELRRAAAEPMAA